MIGSEPMYAKEVVMTMVYKYPNTWITNGFKTNLSPYGLSSAYFCSSFIFHSLNKLLKFMAIAIGKNTTGPAKATVLA